MRIVTLLMVAAILLPGSSCSDVRHEQVGSIIADLPDVTGAKLPVPLPKIPDKLFVAKKYGAVGDGIANDTASIQKAIDDANTVGGGTVVLQGGVFLSGPLKLANSTGLYLADGTVLKMLPYSQYSVSGGIAKGRYYPLLQVSGLHDIAVTGPGAIEGQGQEWWAKYRTKELAAGRPAMVVFTGCTRVLVKGITMHDAPNVHLVASGCTDATMEDITIATTVPSPNTDGFNIRGRNLLVQRCSISCGDDHIALSGPTDGVTIRDCKFMKGHGLSIGSYTGGGLANMQVDNCSFDGSVSALQGKSQRGRGGLVENLRYSNIRITNVRYPISFHSYYLTKPKDPNMDTFEPVARLTPVWRNVTFTNVTVTAAEKSYGIALWGLPEMPIENFTFRNVRVVSPRENQLFHVKDVTFSDDCSFEATDSGLPFDIADAANVRMPNGEVRDVPMKKGESADK